ncbi:MFS general substrate transporter [Coniochaeta ligniaria NRRL 30616]|uniref:MFS general substrate transporter n=1 Tax=Coniochaeta ligniaria NRRL 30616 TaxID=1408157 RepID=A0A1J7IN66_9PEZI|nr:MFS general substrate transporter [Coniochaeta ligniaria NRRL 30616]
MGLWILEPKSDEPVPGTVHLQREAEVRIRNTAHLKHGTGRNSNIVLAPQPSDSPNDPLNWSPARKWYTSIFLSMGTGLMAGTHNFVNPANALMAKLFHTSITTISRSVSIVLLTLGFSAVISSPAARIWGKRPVIIVGNLIAVIGYIIVVARSHSLTALYVGRAIHGLGIAALEYLVSSSVGDLFFVHERGVHLALWHYALSGGNALGQVIATQIVSAQTWVWPFIYTVIVISVYTIVFFFTCPETTYNRARVLDIDIKEELDDDSGTDAGTSPSTNKVGNHLTSEEKNTAVDDAQDLEASEVAEKKRSYWEFLRVYNGRFGDESFARALITPWSAYLLPAVSWASFAYGCSVAFAASFSVALGQIFTKPPYNFTTAQVGLTVLSSFVGATLGNALPGPFSDWTVKYMSNKNNGVYEPEFRIVLTVPAFILGLMGFWGFGMSLEAKSHWMAPVFFYGLATFAGSIQSLISNTYLLDCHRAHAQDGYAAVTITRGILSFIITFVINDWIARDGYKVVYFWIGTLHGLSCIMGMILYVYGKRVRLAVSKSRFIQSKLGSVRNKV